MKKITFIPFIVITLFSISLSAISAETVSLTNDLETAKIIRVGYFHFDGYHMVDADGKKSGYGYDYLQKLSSYTGWSYEYIGDDEDMDWDDMLPLLESGKIDLLTSVSMTPDRLEHFDFSEQPIGTKHTVLTVKSGNLSFSGADFSNWSGMRVGLLRNNSQNAVFDAYAQLHSFTYIPIFLDDSDTQMTALQNGSVDAIISSDLRYMKNEWILAKFNPQPFYVAVKKGNTAVMNKVNKANRQILAEDSNFYDDLHRKHYFFSVNILYTMEELQYIYNCGDLTVGLIPDGDPLLYRQKDGTPAGITYDLLQLIAKISSLSFRYEFIDNKIPVTDYFTTAAIQLAAGGHSSPFFIRSPDTMLSEPLFTTNLVFVGRRGAQITMSDPLVVALSAGRFERKDSIGQLYPQFSFIEYSTPEACLAAVRDNRADVFFDDQYVVRTALQSPQFESLLVFPAYSLDDKIRVMAPSGNEQLLSIINKSILHLDHNTINDVLIANTVSKAYNIKSSDVLYRIRFPAAVTVILFIICMILALVVIISRQRNIKALIDLNNQLSATANAAECANRAKSQFLAQMSHEIRTPLNAVIGLTIIARQVSSHSKNVEEYLEKIHKSSKLLLGIINDVLDMSAIDSGKLKIENASFDLKKLIEEMTSMFYQQAKEKNIAFDVYTKNVTEENVIGDQFRVQQILMNLLSNAIKFTPDGGFVSLTVLQASCSQKKVQFHFSISDTGCGMSPDMMQRLFTPFEQESASTGRKYGGSGLGLSISKRLVEKMNGSISVASDLGKGSVFTVDIPFERAAFSSAVASVKAFSAIRTLIIDDDKESCEYIGILLDRIGVRHTCVMNAVAGLEEMGEAENNNDPYRLCIVDWKMPDMDGITLTRRIRKIFGNDAVIIIISAYDLNEIRDSGIIAGANYFISKPFFQSTVFNTFMQITNVHGISPQPDVSVSQQFDFTGKKVLIAEDVALNMEVVVKLLELVGIEAIPVENGREAIEAFETAPVGTFDCILLDINMPDMDGYETARRIRSSKKENAKTIPVYAMTANAFTSDVVDAINAGMNGHIAKPIEPDILYKTLGNAFKGDNK